MSTIEKLLITPSFFFGVIILVALLGWWFRAKLIQLNDTAWRRINFGVLVVSCLGIWGMLGDNRLILYQREFDSICKIIDSRFFRSIKSYLNEDLYFRAFNNLSNSPNDQYTMVLQWIKANKKCLLAKVDKREPFNVDTLSDLIHKTSELCLKGVLENFKNELLHYNECVTQLRAYEGGLGSHGLVWVYQFFAPLFMALGFGWEFVKFFAQR